MANMTPGTTQRERAMSPLWQKCRRSRVDWFAIFPTRLAIEQIAFERHKTVEAMLAVGIKKPAIARYFELSPTMIYHMAYMIGHRKYFKRQSPVERYCEAWADNSLIDATPYERKQWTGESFHVLDHIETMKGRIETIKLKRTELYEEMNSIRKTIKALQS